MGSKLCRDLIITICFIIKVVVVFRCTACRLILFCVYDNWSVVIILLVTKSCCRLTVSASLCRLQGGYKERVMRWWKNIGCQLCREGRELNGLTTVRPEDPNFCALALRRAASSSSSLPLLIDLNRWTQFNH